MTRRRGAAGLALLAALLVILAIVLHPFDSAPAARTVALDAWPRGLAVDAQTSRAVVVAADVQSHVGHIAVLDTASGQSVRAITVRADPGAVAIDARTGRGFVTVSVGTGGGRVDVLDLPGGRLLGSTVVHHDASGAADALLLAIQADERTGRVFVTGYLPGAGPGFVSMLDATSGRLLRTVAVGPRPAVLAVSESAGRVFVGSAAGVSVLDARSGGVVRSVPLQAPPAALALDERAGRVFVATGGPSDGAGGPPSGGPGGPAGVVVLDASSGAVLRAIPLSAPASALAVDEASGRLFVGQPGGLDSQGTDTGAGRVTVLDAGRGTVLATIAVSQSPVLLADDGHSGQVFVAARDVTTETPAATGRVLALEARSGRLPRTLLTGVAPIALAVDEASGHVVVADYGGTVSTPDAWGWLPGWMRSRLPFLPAPGPRTRPVPGSVSILDATQ